MESQSESKSLIIDILRQINQSENIEDKEYKFPKDIIEVYSEFKKWLNENGAIYPNIEFPIAYLKGRLIGCKTTKNIEENTAILYIPYKLIIDSSKIEMKTSLPSLNKHNSIKIAYFLMKEFDKGDKSFYKPYIDLMLSNNYLSFPAFWNEEDSIELNDHEVDDKISNYKDEINQTYEQIIKKTDVNIFEPVIFKKIYLFIISRQFSINENRTLLIPLADLLNHNPKVDVKYEFLDTINNILTYSSEYDKEDKDLLVYTNCEKYYEYNKKEISNKKQISFDMKNYDKEKLDLKNSDYFILSTNTNQTFKEGEQIYNNYGESSNEYLLINYSFCLIDNKYDSTNIILTTKQADKFTANFVLEYMMKNLVNIGTYDVDNYLQLQFRIPRNKISTKAFNFFKYINILGRMRYEDYVFIKKVELEILESYLNFLVDTIFKVRFPIFKAINILKDMISRTTFSLNQKNIIVFKLTQKINIEFQKEYIQFMLNIVEKCDENTKSYMELIKSIDEEKDYKPIYVSLNKIKKVVKKFITTKLPH